MAQTLSQNGHVEDFPAGVPQFTSLIAAHPALHISRRFAIVRARLLILKQDRVAALEAELYALDRAETTPYYLCSSKRDSNPERRRLLEEIDEALKDYDDFIIRSSKIWAKPSAPQESTIALKQWTLDHANLAREQTEYLHNERDLLSWAASGDDSTMGWLQPRAEKALIWLYGLLKKGAPRLASRDDHVWIFPQATLEKAARALIAGLILVMLPLSIAVAQALDAVDP